MCLKIVLLHIEFHLEFPMFFSHENKQLKQMRAY